MKYLNDTCVFINKMNSPKLIFNVVDYYNKKNDDFCITNYILKELDRMAVGNDDKGNIARNAMNALKLCDDKGNIITIDIDASKKYKKNFDEIRNNYYGHLYDRLYLKGLVDSGQYTREQAKNLWKKDIGECTCVAVAIEDPERYAIVSEDGGKVTLKPNTNIFKIFERSHRIRVMHFDTWTSETNYGKSKDRKKVRV